MKVPCIKKFWISVLHIRLINSHSSLVSLALEVLSEQINNRDVFKNPDDVKQFLQLKTGTLKQEVFAVLFLTKQHRLSQYEEMFLGTIDQCTVHPREIARRCPELNAASVILAHNHPIWHSQTESS